MKPSQNIPKNIFFKLCHFLEKLNSKLFARGQNVLYNAFKSTKAAVLSTCIIPICINFHVKCLFYKRWNIKKLTSIFPWNFYMVFGKQLAILYQIFKSRSSNLSFFFFNILNLQGWVKRFSELTKHEGRNSTESLCSIPIEFSHNCIVLYCISGNFHSETRQSRLFSITASWYQTDYIKTGLTSIWPDSRPWDSNLVVDDTSLTVRLFCGKWQAWGSNSQPGDWESKALTTRPWSHVFCDSQSMRTVLGHWRPWCHQATDVPSLSVLICGPKARARL